MSDHEWVETGRDMRRSDYICEDCGRTKTIIRIPYVTVAAFLLFAVLLVVTIP